MIAQVMRYTLPAAYAVLPEPMNMARADVLLLAIGQQESNFTHRKQTRGPARGFWQFELGGVRAVASHSKTAPHLAAALDALRYGNLQHDIPGIHRALEHNDVLAAVLARLLLWSLPGPLATTSGAAWAQYLTAWRPGKPRPSTWAQAFHLAGIVQTEIEMEMQHA